MEELAKIPGMPFSYWSSEMLRDLFNKYPPLNRDLIGREDYAKIANVKADLRQ